jgi:CDK-activating kinase assembly factor MAT1
MASELKEYDSFALCALCKKKESPWLDASNQNRFQVNTNAQCGHKFCPSCIDQEFNNNKKRQILCPLCRTIVTRDKVSRFSLSIPLHILYFFAKLSFKSLEEIEAERDTAVRRKIATIFNKCEEDFDHVEEFRDYQQFVEDIVFNLVHEIDVEETKQKVEEYKAQNLKEMALNQAKAAEKISKEFSMIQEEEKQKSAKNAEFEVITCDDLDLIRIDRETRTVEKN